MKRILITIILLITFTANSFAQFIGLGLTTQTVSSIFSTLSLLRGYGNMTFYKDYANSQTNANADYSAGSGTATITATRSASNPATYVDASGVVQTLTTSSSPRFTQGYYDTTGFHVKKGIIIEAASTNLVPKSYTYNDATWTVTTLTAADAATTDPAGGSNAASLTASAGNGNIQLTTAVTAQTYSVWLKRLTGSGEVDLTANGGSTWTAVTVTSSWSRFQITAASASQKCGIRIVTNGDAVYAYGSQFEAKPYASTFIPTSTAAVTRNAETLKYAISNNLTASGQTIFVKVTTEWYQTQPAAAIQLFDTDTKQQRLILDATTTHHIFFNPNATDSASVNPLTNNSINLYQSTILGGGYTQATPTATAYSDGYNEATNTSALTTPAWGTSFYVGSKNNSTIQFDAIIENIAIYSGQKSDTDYWKIANTITNIKKINVLTMGDSITYGQNSTNSFGYRLSLQQQLGTSYLFVGNQNNPAFDSAATYSTRHGGIIGQTTSQILARVPINLSTYFLSGTYKPVSAVLIHASTNDITLVSGGDMPTTITNAITNIKSMIDLITAVDPAIVIYVAKIVPSNSGSDANTTTFNTQLASTWAGWVSTSTIHLVDINAAFKADASWATDYIQAAGVHPTDAGYQVMANTWYSCMSSASNQYCDGH